MSEQVTAEQLLENVERCQPRLIADDELYFEPDWEHEPYRAGLQRSYRSASGGYAFAVEDLAYIATLPSHLQLKYFEYAVRWFGLEVALEGLWRMEAEPDQRDFLLERLEAWAQECMVDDEEAQAVELLPASELDDAERAAAEASANLLRAAGYHVSVGKLDRDPFARWDKRWRASIEVALHIEAVSWNLTIDAIRALPTATARSGTGQTRQASRRRRTSAPARDPDRPRESLSAAERQALSDAVARALIADEEAARARTSEAGQLRDCACGCGTFAPTRRDQAYRNASCRQRAKRQREKP